MPSAVPGTSPFSTFLASEQLSSLCIIVENAQLNVAALFFLIPSVVINTLSESVENCRRGPERSQGDMQIDTNCCNMYIIDAYAEIETRVLNNLSVGSLR